MIPDLRLLSAGLGTQSCALALMSVTGQLPRLDAVIFADTQGEVPETYDYLAYLRGILVEAGIPLSVVTAGSLEEHLLAPEPTSKNPTPPAHVRNPDGSKGRIGAYRCSYDFKRRVIEREAKRLCGGRGAWKRMTVEQWIGFSADETHRMKPENGCRCGHTLRAHGGDRACTKCACAMFDAWRKNRWPLVELRMRRDDTIRWFAKNGFRTPPRSACWFCPNSRNSRWQSLQAEHPDLFERACALDESMRGRGGFNRRGALPFEGEMFLHRTLIPLCDADLRTEAQVIADAGQLSLDDEFELAGDCAEGCFT